MKIFTSLLLMFATCFSVGYAGISDSSNQKAAPVYQDSKEIFIKANDAQIFCRVFGKGDPIIVIHGGPGLSQDYLLPQMAKLAQTNLVIFYDQRGCGLSTGAINEDSIQIKTFVDDLEAIRKSFGYKKVTILGHSWGGFLAMQYALVHPESIHKLILLNTMPPSSEEFSLFVQEWIKRMAPYHDELKAIKDTPEFTKGNPSTIEKYYRIIFGRYCYNPEKADLLNLYMSPKASIDGAQVYEIFRQNLFTKPFNFHDQLKQLKIPTLIVHGDFDPIPPSTAEKLHESLDGSKYILIKNCGHFPYIETPEELFKQLNIFLGEAKHAYSE